MSLNLRSSLSQWFIGSTGPDVRSPSAGKRLLIFVTLLVLAFGLVWVLFQASRPAYQKAINIGAERIYDLGRGVVRFREVGEKSVFRYFSTPPFEAELYPKPLFSNLPFLITLLLVTPGMRPRRRVLRLAAALGLIYLSHLAFLITKVEVAMISAAHPNAGNPGLWRFLDNFFEISGKTFFPIAIWLVLALPYMLGKVDQRDTAAAPRPLSRNAPCPCGSGRKYKHCCGA